MNINVLLFDRFETLDAMGPVEMLARPANYTVGFFSIEGGTVTSSQGVPVVTRSISDMDRTGTLLLPGGWGVRGLDSDRAFLTTLKSLADDAEWVLSVCNGSVLLSACGALDERKATSNKKLFQDALDSSGNVAWVSLASAITGSGTGLRHPGIGFRVRLLDPAVGALPTTDRKSVV